MPAANKVKQNMVASLGADFFGDRFRNALFLYDGKVMKISRVGGAGVQCENVETGREEIVAFDFFDGFKKFAYPPLGYRRLAPNIVAFATKNHTYMRGLRDERIDYKYSPVSRQLTDERVLRLDYKRNDRERELLRPTYDKLDDLNELIAGDRANVVLNENILIEPDLFGDEDKFAVYHRRRRAGVMLPDKKIRYFSNEFENLVKPHMKNIGDNHA